MKASGLAWTSTDYVAAGQEIPSQLIDNPELTEGELMTAEELAEFIKDSIATLRILSDKQSKRYTELAESYQADLKYLLAIGQIDDEDYNKLIKSDNLHFS